MQFGSDGAATLHRDLGGLDRVVQAAQGDEGEFHASSARKFKALLTQLEKVLMSAETPYDQVIWVIKAHRLPHSVPQQMAALLKRVNKSGRVARLFNGEAGKWLFVISGRYTSVWAEYYLRGPISDVNVG